MNNFFCCKEDQDANVDNRAFGSLHNSCQTQK